MAKITLKNVTLSYFYGFEPKEEKNKKTGAVERYVRSTDCLLDKDEHAALIKEIRAEMKRVTPIDSDTGKPVIVPADRKCLKNGEIKDEDTGEVTPLKPEYANCMIFRAAVSSRKNADSVPDVPVVGQRKVLDPKTKKLSFPRLTEKEIFSGCKADVIADIYWLKGTDEYPARISASLEAVRLRAIGTAFGRQAIDADEAFEDDIEDDDEDGFGGDTSEDDDDDI